MCSTSCRKARTPENLARLAAALAPIHVELHGHRVRLLDLDDLIRSKAAAGRAKDLVDLEALRVLAAKR